MALNILELFAGVGGFRIGFEESDADYFKTVIANQWEPGKKRQDAFEIYNKHFPDSLNLNIPVQEITEETLAGQDIDVIVGGFPCQNYSVASSSKHALGIEGEKGVLLWDIVRLTELTQPKYLLLENVDRLLTSPAKQRGRDFAILLSVFNRLGYTVEWKVMQSDLMGFPQRRKRVFIFMHKQDEPSHLLQLAAPSQPSQKTERNTHLTISDDTLSISENFTGQFWNAGISTNFKVHTWEEDIITSTQPVLLGDILETDVDESYYYTPEQVERINYLRGSKSFDRVNAQGHAYKYSEGAMTPYDYPTRASRTLLTSEGNVSRTSHVIKDPQTQRYRRLTPIECERLQGFPDNWTEGISKRMRYFTMGNALVTGIVKEIGDQLKKYDESLH